MSTLEDLRRQALLEPDPKLRAERLARIVQIEAAVRECDARLAARTERPKKSGYEGRLIGFVLGFVVTGGMLVGAYLDLSGPAAAALFAAVVLAAVAVLRVIYRRGIDKPASKG